MDGATGIPDPATLPPPFTTQYRIEIKSEMDEALADVNKLLQHRLAALHGELITLKANIASWRQEVESLTKAPTPPGVLRRTSQVQRDADLTQRRHAREQVKLRQPIEQRKSSLLTEIARAELRIGELDGLMATTRRERKDFLEWVVATYVLATSIYDTKLVHHHVLGSVVQTNLAESAQVVDEWRAAAKVTEAEEEFS